MKYILILILIVGVAFGSERPDNQKYIRSIIKECKFMYPDVVFKMYVQESGMGTSNLARNHNNVLGMKFPSKRPTLADGKTNSGFANYKTVRQSIWDFKLYEMMYLTGKSKSEYMRYLKDVYSRDKTYLDRFL